jgi:hypothetical protein
MPTNATEKLGQSLLAMTASAAGDGANYLTPCRFVEMSREAMGSLISMGKDIVRETITRPRWK